MVCTYWIISALSQGFWQWDIPVLCLKHWLNWRLKLNDRKRQSFEHIYKYLLVVIALIVLIARNHSCFNQCNGDLVLHRITAVIWIWIINSDSPPPSNRIAYGKVTSQPTSNQCLYISSQLIYQLCVVLNHQSVVEAIEVDILNEGLLVHLYWNMRDGSCPRFSSPVFSWEKCKNLTFCWSLYLLYLFLPLQFVLLSSWLNGLCLLIIFSFSLSCND